MPNYGTYATLNDLRNALDIAAADTAADARLHDALRDASAWIEQHCQRWFGVRSETRYFTAGTVEDSSPLYSYTTRSYGYAIRSAASSLLVDDLLSVTSLATDADGDRTYEDTWTTTDYDLEPVNLWPKWEIRVTPNGNYSFPAGIAQGVKIVGFWGYGDGESATPYEDSGTDTAEALDDSETGVDVVSGSAIKVGQTILVESEQMYVTAVSSNTLTVVRGVNGTTAATHATAKDIYVYRYPRNVRRACIRAAARMFRAESAPFGVVGAADMGNVNMVEAVDRETLHLLAPFRRLVVG